ncbi:ANTAR domain-containing response regulator [Butyrivibrio hungatei]|uniref:ANTAR domain-containing protein n=1 Tax=Butyrivibrio hungatei TaxID=185008 RepID=A0A1D9NYZ1_9FIRM|nr:ANTAR domain-containing protein [Butyrivibrio hungatei]AOZ95421.1 ANTAR domain-containing protein [Butyrivibrio hungatei]
MNIIVAFAKTEDGLKFKSILGRGGYDNVLVCSSGMQALSAMEDLGSGVVICGHRLSDMLYNELLDNMPEYFQMLMVASPDKAPFDNADGKLIFLQSPLKKSELFSSLSMMLEGVSRRKKKAKERRLQRSAADQKTIDDAKHLLMERHHMTEPEAHKYLQKCAMDSGTGLLETAEMVISLSEI